VTEPRSINYDADALTGNLIWFDQGPVFYYGWLRTGSCKDTYLVI